MSEEAEQLITVIGRGHSGTRALSQTLYASGVFLGHVINSTGDTLPPERMYEACRVIGPHVRWTGDLTWDFGELHEMEIDPRFEELVSAYVAQLHLSRNPNRGWKLPETTLAYPWVVRMFPEVKYIHIVRDPRDGLLRPHRNTDDLSELNVAYPPTDDELARRAVSWKYQHDIVKATPRPKHFLSIRFEDLILDQERTLQKLEGFLGIPLARIVVDETRVGQWRTDRRLLPYIGPLVDDMRALGYEA